MHTSYYEPIISTVLERDEKDFGVRQPLKPSNWIMKPDSRFKLLWNMIVNGLIVYSLFLIPFVLCTSEQVYKDYRSVELVLDGFMLVDIILTFFTAFVKDIDLQVRFKQIAWQYFKTYFLLDCIATLPGILTGEMYYFIYAFKIFRYTQHPRIINEVSLLFNWLSKYTYFLDKLTKENMLKMIKIVLNLSLFIHIFACIWIALGDQTIKGWIKSSDEYKDHTSKFTNAYITASYFIVTTITTVGYGDFSASDDWEKLFLMMLEFVGLTMFSFITGSVASLSSSQSSGKLLSIKK